MDLKESYLLEEMKAGRNRIDQEIAAMNKFETVSVAAIGAIYLLFFAHRLTDHAALIVLTGLPALICGYGLFRYRGHASIVQVHEEYAKRIERHVLGYAGGLVSYYDENKTGQLKTARFAFWILMFLITFAVFVTAIVAPEKLGRVHAIQTIEKVQSPPKAITAAPSCSRYQLSDP